MTGRGQLRRINPQVIKARVESNTTGGENLVKATDGLCMNNSRPSEGYRTDRKFEWATTRDVKNCGQSKQKIHVNRGGEGRAHENHSWEQERRVSSFWQLEGLQEERSWVQRSSVFWGVMQCRSVVTDVLRQPCQSHLEGQAVQETTLDCLNLDGTSRL